MKKKLPLLALCLVGALVLFISCNNGQQNTGFGKLILKNVSVVDAVISQIAMTPEYPDISKTQIHESVTIRPGESKVWDNVAAGQYAISVSFKVGTSTKGPVLSSVVITSDSTTTLSFDGTDSGKIF